MIWILFALMGGFMATIIIIAAIQAGDLALIFAAGIPGIFLAIGATGIKKGINKYKARKRVLDFGKACTGYIVGHEQNWSTRINNRPVINVVIEIVDGTEKITGTFETNTTKKSKYPIGGIVDVYKYDGDYAWDRKVKGTATNVKLDNLGIEVIHDGY